MSPLTDEQRKRIEENRLKALEKRAAALSKSKNPSNNPITNVSKPIFSTHSNADAPNTNYLPPHTSNKTLVEQNSSLPVKPEVPNQNSSNNIANKFYESKKPSFVPKYSFIRGDCVMLNRKRFYVDISYHKELIEVFKTIPSKLYDTQTKKWNFLLKDYEKLMSAVKDLEVILVPIPLLIRKTFASASDKRVIKEYDLSSLDPVLGNALLPFQVEGVNFGIQKGGRVLIADDMGLGKTIQAIAIADYFKDWPLLVVTPSSVRYSWKEAFHRWLPSMDPQEITVINSGKEHIPNNKVILISYDLLSTKKNDVLNRKFSSIILDESHFLKNYKTNRTRAAIEVMEKMSRIIMLSGTPALSRPMELYTQLRPLRPQGFLKYKEFGMRYCDGKTSNYGSGWDFSGSSRMEELQLLLEEMVMIRRLKSDVIAQLPAKLRQMIVLDPSLISTKDKTLRSLREKLEAKHLSAMERRGCLLEYFHYTGDIKLKSVCDYVSDLLENDKKFLCFAHHKNVLRGLSRVIENKNIDFIYIDGSVSSERRKHLCDRFQFNDACKVAVLSITAANCGITLTAASLVVFAELFWNPGILTQAEDRAHRIGQQNSVIVQYLVARGTADDEIWPMVQKKLDVLNKAGLSKDDFKSADMIVYEEKESTIEDYFDVNFEEDYESPEKRLKLDF